jgi:predicted DNA-binding transcriptional regulator AlpA
MLLINQSDVLKVIGRQDSKTLLNWYSAHDWFPAPAIRGRPPRWIDSAIQDWIDRGIPRLYEQKVELPELRDCRSAHEYAMACRSRLDQVLAEKQKEAESQDRISRIVRVYRMVPQTA